MTTVVEIAMKRTSQTPLYKSALNFVLLENQVSTTYVVNN